jgi:hypothetical protein
MEDRWSDVEATVMRNFVMVADDGVYDERPIDAATAMYVHGMSGEDIYRACAQLFNAGWDARAKGE